MSGHSKWNNMRTLTGLNKAIDEMNATGEYDIDNDQTAGPCTSCRSSSRTQEWIQLSSAVRPHTLSTV